ncbi:hypothetical protein BU17DRAFT_58804 [Hysterangium stoloniferum]|nr:hypothetical protein BU17DRAFT_58804 [Hysterangium stoloniferum]
MAGIKFNVPLLENITIPDLFTKVAQLNPTRDLIQILYDYPNSDTPIISQRFTWSEVIQHAQNAAADLRRRSFGTTKNIEIRKPGDPLVVVGMLGAHGYEYYVNLLACVINRWTVLLISPKNSLNAIEHILGVSNASFLLIDDLGHTFKEKMNLPKISTLTFSHPEIYRSPDVPTPALPQLSQKELEKEFDLPVFLLHTSGSTGHPKVITWTHRFVLTGIQISHNDCPESIGKHFYCIPPLFHAMGMFTFIVFPPAHGYILLCPISSPPRPPSARALLAYSPWIKNGIAAMPPSILEELWEMSSAWQQQKELGTNDVYEDPVQTVVDNLWMTMFAGAPLRREVGVDLIKKGVALCTAYGSTELLPASKHYVQPNILENWEYIEFREGYNLHFLPLEGDDNDSNLRELIVGPARRIPAVINHEDPLGFATNDIWEQHPKVDYLWKHHSRKGDVTVLSNGEKTDNRQIENLLLQDPNIQHVVVFGAGRSLNGALIDPSSAFNGDIPTFLDTISPTITNANNIIPTHSRLLPELIIVARRDKPFALTEKGTIKRGVVMETYKAEIEAAYHRLEEGNLDSAWQFEGDLANVEDIRTYMRRVVLDVLGKVVPDTMDLFVYGLDSLLSLRLRSAIISFLSHVNDMSIPHNIVYNYPSIDSLVSFVVGVVSGNKRIAASSAQDRIKDSIDKFSQGFRTHKPSGHPEETNGMVIALTGSTGSVGCFLLDLLLQRDDVDHIYLLNRHGDVRQHERQAAGFLERSLDLHVLQAKEAEGLITYLDIDLSRGDLALNKEDYDQLRGSLTHIIHCAWELNFNLILASYEQVHIAGVRNLINLALASPLNLAPRFVFLSSIASSSNYRSSPEKPLVPEEPIEDPSIPADQGYGQSKYVSERVLVRAVQEAGLRATIVRIGQLSGDNKCGVWNRNEHVPILIRSSVEIGMVPVDAPAVHWLPSDIAASAILRQTLESIKPLEYFHVDNPTPTPWLNVAQAIATYSPTPLQLVDFSRWLSRVGSDELDAERVPAKRLLDFFQSLVHTHTAPLAYDRSAKVAPEILVGEINGALIKKFVEYQLG